jgi:hypothetical protein
VAVLPHAERTGAASVAGARHLEERVDVMINARRPRSVALAIDVADDEDDQAPGARESD